jgi:gallate decarboxylase subunit C
MSIKMKAEEINDLRSALKMLKKLPGQLISTETSVNPDLELAAVYKHISRGATLASPASAGPAMMFEKIEGFNDVRILVGVLSQRERVAHLMGNTIEGLPQMLLDAVNEPVNAVSLKGEEALCQEVVHTAPLDIRKIIPAVRSTELECGPFFCLGLLRAEDPETGEADVTIHRLIVQEAQTLTVCLGSTRHIEQFRKKAEKMGNPLPVSINIGLDPAVYLGACFEPPTTPIGFDELSIAGALRKHPVELVDCVSVKAKSIANAEIVIEGEIMPNERMDEDIHTKTGYAIPEFTGVLGAALPDQAVFMIKAITHRKNPIMQTTIMPGEEHCNLAGIPTEASILRMLNASMPGKVKNVYCHPSGGGKLVAIIQFIKSSLNDEGRQRQAALIAFTAFQELKHVILVDDDVNIYDTRDVLWAMTVRYQGDISTVFIPGVRCHDDEPSQMPEFNPLFRDIGITCKTIFDCTVPYKMKARFKRPHFQDIDAEKYKIHRY